MKVQPITNKDNSVQFHWVKMLVNGKKQQWYADSPGYRPISKTGSGTVFGFRRVLDQNEPLPHHLELCNEYEIKKLNGNSNE